ncbi:MAG: hypothetical protein ACM3L6_04845 [Deltaproteobacteria bacterium]
MSVNKVVVALGVVSIVIGIVSRLLVAPVPPVGLEAEAFLQFAGVCFLLSIALSLLKK